MAYPWVDLGVSERHGCRDQEWFKHAILSDSVQDWKILRAELDHCHWLSVVATDHSALAKACCIECGEF